MNICVYPFFFVLLRGILYIPLVVGVKKLWFIPLGLVCAYLFNILRITLIAIAIEHHPDWFELLHEYVFKYMFYFMLFCLWLLWTHRIAKTTP